MENFVLILCVVLTFAIGIIPVKWRGSIKKYIREKNRNYLDRK